MKIIKKTKGKKKYFYLKHSFRKGNRVITKEKYLGTKIPENVEKIKFDFKRQFREDLYKRLGKIKNNFQKEWKRIPNSAKKRELKEIAIAFTYHTNAIEGSTITLDETRQIIHDKIAPNKPIRDIKETESHNKVFLDMLKKKEKITNKLLLRWHKEIFSITKPDIVGKFRNYLVTIAGHLPPDPEEINKLMIKLIKFMNKEKINPVELAARTHYRFEKIHPFGDGNGRIGRLLMNHILWYSGYPMLIIEYKKRSSYYKALKKEEDGFVNYFVRRYLSVHKRRLK
ncbi:MAG: Fic family protein [Candidatus Nanoarchaeia archaeon]